MKKILLLVATLCAAWSISACADGVGIVDMKTIFSTSPKVKEIKAALNKQFASEKDTLQKMSKDLQAHILKYQKEGSVSKKEDKLALQKKITEEEAKLRDAQAKFQQDVFAAQNQHLTQFMDSVKAAVKVVAEKNKLNLVIPSNDVLYTAHDMDITQEVMTNLK